MIKITPDFVLYPTAYSYPPFVVSLLIISVGIFVLIKKFHSPVNRTYFLVHLSSFTWLFGFSILYSLRDINAAPVVYKVLYTGVIFIPITFYHFIHRFLKRPKCNVSIIIHYLIGLVFSSLVFLGNGVLAGVKECYWGYQTKAGPINTLFLTYFFIVFSYCFVLLLKAVRDPSRDQTDVNRIRYVFWAFLIALFASTDWLPVYGINFYPLGFIFMTLFTLVTMTAILKHRLFDIGIIIRRSFIYSSLISTITLIYIFIILVSERFFRTLTGYGSLIVALVVSSVVATTFMPLRRRLESFIDKYFFKIDPEELKLENAKLKGVVQEQDRMRSVATLAAGMAHEIKNPLTSIKIFAEYLPKKYDDPEFRDMFSRIVVDEVDRVNNIVKQLLEFSKPSPPDLKPVLLGDLLDQTLGLINNNMVRYNIEVVKELDIFAMVQGDRNQLKQAFLNLFLNAIQSMRDGGKLHVSAHSEHGGRTRIAISDTGCGMTPDQAQHAFDPFFTTKEDGTGLGLAIVHSIITKHGGKIEIKSKAGEGTTVSVFLKSLD